MTLWGFCGTIGDRAALPTPGGQHLWGMGRQALQICAASEGLYTRRRRGCGGQWELECSQGRRRPSGPGLAAGSEGFSLTLLTLGPLFWLTSFLSLP